MRATQDRYHVTRPLTHEAATGALDTELDHFRRKKQTSKCIRAPVIGGVCVAGWGISLLEHLNVCPHEDVGFQTLIGSSINGNPPGLLSMIEPQKAEASQNSPLPPHGISMFSSEKSAGQRIEKFLSFKNSLTSRSLLNHYK